MMMRGNSNKRGRSERGAYDDSDGPPPSKKPHQGPDEWLYTPPMGKVIIGKFLPMKTPLCEEYDRQISPEYHFHPADVFEVHGEKQVRLWFDLTMSERYYKAKEVGEHKCRYMKLRMEGHSGPPSREEVSEFISLVKKYYEIGLVVVHCTHGFNRTGFAIIAYLIEVEGMNVVDAIQVFRQARPNGIYKQDYINELIHRYGVYEVVKAPASPEWRKGPIADDDYRLGYPKLAHMHQSSRSLESQARRPRQDYTFLEQLDASLPPPIGVKGTLRRHGDGHEQASSGRPSLSHHSRDSFPQAATQFNADLPLHFLKPESEESERIKKLVAEWLNAKKPNQFAGSQPVSMEGPAGNKNYAQLASSPYMVSLKADGTRCLMVMEGEGKVYALNRNNDVFLVTRLTFPKRDGPGHIEGTLVDAEMVVDEVDGARIPRFLIYDIMRSEGCDVTNELFSERYERIERDVVGPRNAAMQRGEVAREQECAGVRVKKFYSLEHARHLADPQFQQKIAHHVDGLIFQPAREPYKPGAFKMLMKWKCLEESTVDFRLKIERRAPNGQVPRNVAALYVLYLKQSFAVIDPATPELQAYDNKIVECSFPPQGRQWKVERVRNDKTTPNAHATADSVATTIRHQITRGQLLHYIDSIIPVKSRQAPQGRS